MSDTQCCAVVAERGQHQCRNKASIFRPDKKSYCRVHDPGRLADRKRAHNEAVEQAREGRSMICDKHNDYFNTYVCGKPCPPDRPCNECKGYWERVRTEGFWVDGKGWTDAAMREMRK